MESALLGRAISCEVCLEQYCGDEEARRARVLPGCGHSFCHACISGILGGGGFPVPTTGAPKVCPTCRSPIPTSVSALELPRNFALEYVAQVVIAMGVDVWMASALVAEEVGFPRAPPSRVWPALRAYDDLSEAQPASEPMPSTDCAASAAVPPRARPPAAKAMPSRSALALAASGVPAPVVVHGILAALRAHGSALSLTALCEHLAVTEPRLWPPIGFLPRYYGERCLAVPAVALTRPDPPLLRAFVQWATSPEAAPRVPAASAHSMRIGGTTCVRGAEMLHLERVRHGSLAEVVCAGGSRCAIRGRGTPAISQSLNQTVEKYVAPARGTTRAAGSGRFDANSRASGTAAARHVDDTSDYDWDYDSSDERYHGSGGRRGR